MGILDRKPNVEKIEKKKDVEGLIKALKHKDRVSFGWKAAEALGKIGDARAVEPLIQALKYEDIMLRGKAAEALGKIGDARAVEPLIQALKYEENYSVAKAAAEALGKMGKPAVAPLIQALKDERFHVQSFAAGALEKIGWKPGDDTEKVYYLIAKHEWDELAALGKLAVEPLIQALKDGKSADVISGAAKALAKIGDARAAGPIAFWSLHYENWLVRQGLMMQLFKMGEAAVEPLIQHLKYGRTDVRRRAASALGEIGSAKAVEPLIEAQKDKDSTVHKLAEEALEKIRTKKS